MIPLELQDGLEKRMQELFKHFKIKKPTNNPTEQTEYISLNIYKQNLPEKPADDISLYPYLVIKLIEGEQSDVEGPQQVKVLFIVGVFDDGDKYQGYRDVSNILQKIYENLIRKPVISNKFEMQFPLKWVIHEEDVFPYHFGGYETNWQIPIAQREDVEAII